MIKSEVYWGNTSFKRFIIASFPRSVNVQGTWIPLPSPQFIDLSLIVTVQEFVLQAFKKKNMVLANFPLSPFGKCPTIFLEDHCLYAKLNHDDAA